MVHFATLIESIKRPQDIFGRIGGEEFALFLPATTLDEAEAMAARIVYNCQTISAGPGEDERLSVSAGIAGVSGDDVDIASTMRRADQALYVAKATGRGRSAGAGDDARLKQPA